MDLGYRVKKYKIHRIQLDTKHSFLVKKDKILSTYMYKIVKGEYVYSQILSVYHMLQYTNKRYKNLAIIFHLSVVIISYDNQQCTYMHPHFLEQT